MKIIDNFLPDIYLQYLLEIVLSNKFDWYYQSSKVEDNDGGQQFTHIFFSNNKHSNYLSILDPIFKILNVKKLIRVKANFTFSTNKIENFKFHTDTHEECNTAIFYLNTNNGKTLFRDSEVESVANRMVIFPSYLEHTGTTHTDTKYRLVLNVNYKDIDNS